MRVSAFMFLTDETIGPAELAVALEERGFAGLWVPEHPHIPTKRETPMPAAYGGGELPRMYLRLLDPFVALTAAASVTTSLRLGTGVCLLALRDPVVTAKEVATLDVLSGGRVDFGVGYGWNADEFADHDQRFAERHRVVREKVELMRSLWGDEVGEYTGRHVSLQPSWAWPKPAQTAGSPGLARRQRSHDHAGGGPLGGWLVPHPVAARRRRHRHVPQDGRRGGTQHRRRPGRSSGRRRGSRSAAVVARATCRRGGRRAAERRTRRSAETHR